MHPRSDRDLAIECALRVSAHQLDRTTDGGWRLVIANGTLTTLRARMIDEDWLAVTSPWRSPERSWWPLLRLNAGLGGCARLARACGADLEMRGEIFVGGDAANAGETDRDGVSLVERVAALCDDVASAGHEVIEPLADEVMDAATMSPSDSERLVTLCGDAGWSAIARTAGHVQVALDTRTTTFQATLSFEEDSRLRAVVPLTESAVVSGAAQDAVALLLLDTGAQLRTVKGLAMRQGDVEWAGLAVAGERLPAGPAAIDRALAALSVACDIVGREIQALQDPQLARDYLALRHPNLTISRSLPYSNSQEDTPCLQLPS
jgi:hypothetical protein